VPPALMRLQAFGMLTLEPERLKNQLTTTRKRSPEMAGFFTGDAQAACDFSFSTSKFSLQRLALQRLAGRSFDDLQPEGGSFSLEIVDLQVAMLSLIKFGSSIDELHPVAQHAVDQSG
jgi:hypothetical protein